MEDEIICPVCKQYIFTPDNIYCPVCNWCQSSFQELHPDWKNMDNLMSLEEAREAYKEGREIY